MDPLDILPLAHDVDPPEVADATGASVPETGSTRRQLGGGLSTGTYFHLIAGAS